MFSQSGPLQVVRKEIRPIEGQTKEAYYETFRNEHNCLLLLDRLAHPNIIPLLGSFTYGDRHQFLFPSYETDLRRFLKSESRFGDFHRDFTFFSALRGLASALCSTHKLHLEQEKHGLDIDAIGYHHDIRPANVLISQDTFILADFGLGKFKPTNVPSQTPWKTGEGDYLAPECMDESFSPQNVGRAIDVWAFGCLMVEVVIYMKRGAVSLQEFREQRLSPSWSERWQDSCFHDKNGNPKSVVLQWLDSLTNGLLHPGLVKTLANLSRKTLKRTPKDRPTIEDICADLTWISLTAHLVTVRDLFDAAKMTEQTPNRMRLWFEYERFAAFAYVIGLDCNETTSYSTGNLSSRYDEYLEILKAMAVLLQVMSGNVTLEMNTMRKPESSAENSNHVGKRFENDIHEQVESLWNLLSTNQQRKAEAAWLRAMLDTEDVRRLDHVERAFKSEDDPKYEKAAAMAMMKRVGLHMNSTPTNMPEDFLVPENDVQRRLLVHRSHEFGLFKGIHVLIEWMNYCEGWENVPPEQRAIVMSLRAQGFSDKIKPAGMRTLDCIGTFENTGETPGYAFLNRIPISDPEVDISSSTATLLQLIESRDRQPLLGDKLRLASALAQFIGDFHNVGWLHKNFHSNNILFFNIKDGKQGNISTIATQVMERPYVVGFQESRLGGRSWHTAGPSDHTRFEDYQHPEYARTLRYRATYDYYSLGLILLELAFWKPLSVWSRNPRGSRMSLSEFRQELVEKHVPYLGLVVGAVYRDVVHFCLSGAMDSSEDLDSGVLEDFAKHVTEPLNELAEASI